MKINDMRHKTKKVDRDNLTPGEVYITETGMYVIATLMDTIVSLESGNVEDTLDYDIDSEFTPVNARLEIE